MSMREYDDIRDDSNSLEHYGVKGMKWGVRKDNPGRIRKKVRAMDPAFKQQVKVVAGAAAVTAGVAFVDYQLTKGGGLRLSEIRKM